MPTAASSTMVLAHVKDAATVIGVASLRDIPRECFRLRIHSSM